MTVLDEKPPGSSEVLPKIKDYLVTVPFICSLLFIHVQSDNPRQDPTGT